MVHITFIAPDGSRKDVEATVGDSIMQTALAKGVTGIVAECGGCLSCATCHSYVSEEWIGKLPEKSTDETTMVECAVDVRPTSRLTCQIIVTEALDGLVVEIPKSQY